MSFMSPHPVITLILGAALLVGTGPLGLSKAEAADTATPTVTGLPDRYPAFPELVQEKATQLSALPAGQDPLALFRQEIGPRIGLKDAAMTLGAKNIPAAMAKELILDDVKQAASRLMKGLAAWQLARSAKAAATGTPAPQVAEAQTAWFTEELEPDHAVRQLLTLLQQPAPADPSAGTTQSPERSAHLLLSAAAVENWATQTVNREWFRLYNWKDAVRQQRALARLCGTWQWMIHNHQNHREEKTSVIFAPPGAEPSASPAEIIAAGDTLYLRWETKVGVQEDSLVFSGEGQRLEGTFINSTGGWGSITGKQTASCAGVDKPTSAPRRHH